MTLVLWIVALLALLWGVARLRLSVPVWTGAIAGGLVLLGLGGALNIYFGILLWSGFLLAALVVNSPALRQQWVSAPLLRYVRNILPPMSDTEKQAIEAGSVWWEAELFAGNPQWEKLLTVSKPALTEEEQAFIDGPVQQVCAMLDDWQISQELEDLPEEVWQFLKDNRFFGMIIPKEYDGLAFSAYAHSEIVMQIASRSGSAGVTVMVPNSLGPAELLLHYGTDEQKQYYLPRLAKGEEVPCFALTSPVAGSDAGAMPDRGVVCRQQFEGKDTLGLRVTWNKRYITLSSVATVLGLAFKAYDPDHLLGEQEELGITCALIPTNTPGVEIGRRHRPLNAVFHNGPTSGQDVFIPMDRIIGGQDRVGQGWRMLMESLSVGRGISLPASGTSSAKLAARLTGAYARVRQQFKLPIGRFEGVEEVLARIAGMTYMMDAARLLTLSAIDAGEKPSVVSAIVKYHLTEGMRQVINDAMDVHGGRGICMGPMNYLARAYQAIPISITVEGANILTRSMIIFGQGAMRCHPYLLKEVDAAAIDEQDEAVDQFDQVLFDHLGYSVTNGARSLLYGLSRAQLAPSAGSGSSATYFRELSRLSAAFALLADSALLMLGGALKRKEKLSGRFADALSHLYLCSASLKRFEDSDRPEADRPLLDWACQYSLYQVQQALDEILRNFPNVWVGRVLRPLIFPTGRYLRYPDDRLGHKAASILLEPSEARDRLTAGIYIGQGQDDITGRMEDALQKVIEAEPISRKLRDVEGQSDPLQAEADWWRELQQQGVLTQDELDTLLAAQEAVDAVIQVDDFAIAKQEVKDSTNQAA